MNLDLCKFVLPESPLIGSSTRRNCPCCEETLNFAFLDIPTPKNNFSNSSHAVSTPTNPHFRVIYKNYSVGNLLKVVRRRPISPISVKSLQKIKLNDFSTQNIKKKPNRLSVIQKNSQKKNLNVIQREKDFSNTKIDETKSLTQKDLKKLWEQQEIKMKKIGGLNKLQKILKRSNLPPLATSIKNLRYRKMLNSTITLKKL
jgi:hypothetical protein